MLSATVRIVFMIAAMTTYAAGFYHAARNGLDEHNALMMLVGIVWSLFIAWDAVYRRDL